MSFPKFSDWVSLKEDAVQQQGQNLKVPNAGGSSAVNKALAGTVGMPKQKRTMMLKQLAQKAAGNPSTKPKDIAAIAAAAEEDS
jgi:hypothetical protein